MARRGYVTADGRSSSGRVKRVVAVKVSPCTEGSERKRYALSLFMTGKEVFTVE